MIYDMAYDCLVAMLPAIYKPGLKILFSTLYNRF